MYHQIVLCHCIRAHAAKARRRSGRRAGPNYRVRAFACGTSLVLVDTILTAVFAGIPQQPETAAGGPSHVGHWFSEHSQGVEARTCTIAKLQQLELLQNGDTLLLSDLDIAALCPWSPRWLCSSR